MSGNITNKEKEKLILKKLLNNSKFSYLNKCNKIDYDREKPDCCITLSENISIGIEITISINENLKKTREENRKLKDSVSFCPTLFEKEKMSSEEIKNILKCPIKSLSGAPYGENQLEEITFNEIVKSINNKIKKFDTYDKFDKN